MGEVKINDVSLANYGVTLVSGAYAQLLTPADTKEWVSNDDPRKNGVEYLTPSTIYHKERSVNLVFIVKGEDKSDFLSKYTTFIELLQSHINTFYVADLDKYYHLKYESCTSFDNFSLKACKLAVKFTEPDPTNNLP